MRDMAGAALLVVDDDSVVRLSIDRAARKMGLARQVDFAKNGREAMQRLSELVEEDAGRSLVVLLDINMPEMGGFETLDAMSERPELTGVPVFMLSSSDAPTDIERAYRSGASGYLVKGATMDSVHDTVAFVEHYLSRVHLLPPAAYRAQGAEDFR